MGVFSLFIIAVGLSMDACAVAICKGLAMQKDIQQMEIDLLAAMTGYHN